MGIATLIVVLFGFSSFWYLPHRRSNNEEQQRFLTVQKEFQQRVTLVGDLQKRVAASVQENNIGTNTKDLLSLSRHLGDVLHRLVSEDKKLLVNTIQIVKTEKQKEFRDVQLGLELEGSFKSIGSFVERLEDSSVLSEVSKIDVARINSDLERCIAKVNIKVRLFGDENAD